MSTLIATLEAILLCLAGDVMFLNRLFLSSLPRLADTIRNEVN